MATTTSPPSFPRLVQEFFSVYLLEQHNASQHTIASYRDTFRLLLQYSAKRLGKKPSDLTLTDLDASLVLGFLDHLETERGNSVASRNARLAAIRSFLNYAGFRDPSALAGVQRVRAIPNKRYDRLLLGFLSREEMQAILDAPDCSTWSGQRDHAMLATFYNTGARVSEVVSLQVKDVDLEHRRCIQIVGKGRKQRQVPLWKSTVGILKSWRRQLPNNESAPLFPNRFGQPMTRSGVESRLNEAVRTARERQPSLDGRKISPHTLRHTTAMHLLQSGVDITVIALWLGHESIETTHRYIEADLEMKRKALETVSEPVIPRHSYQPPDRLLAFLESL
ncbi:MAG: site-specific integrase [Firmicutes bacterium]|jgi:site-specific recombinase XerD|nr:site-specific integrase [Bacillota bacterium]